VDRTAKMTGVNGRGMGEVVELFSQAELRPGTLLGGYGSTRLVSSELTLALASLARFVGKEFMGLINFARY
jgi:hypothetical protein